MDTVEACLVCGVKIFPEHSKYNLFDNNIRFRSGKNVCVALSEIVGETIQQNNVHSNVICQKCWKSCAEYENLQIKLQEIKNSLCNNYKSTLTALNNTIKNTPTTNVAISAYKVYSQGNTQVNSPKRIVLPASKLQPLPANFVISLNNVLAHGHNGSLPVKFMLAPPTTSLSSTKQSIASTPVFSSAQLKNKTHITLETIKNNQKNQHAAATSVADETFNSFTKKNGNETQISSKSMPILMLDENLTNPEALTSVSNFNFTYLPNDLLSAAVLTNVDESEQKVEETASNEDEIEAIGIDESELENCEERQMKIDEEWSSNQGTVEYMQVQDDIEKSESNDGSSQKQNNYFDMSLLGSLEGVKLEVLPPAAADNDSEHAMVLESDTNGPVLRVLSRGERLFLGDSEISLVGAASAHGPAHGPAHEGSRPPSGDDEGPGDDADSPDEDESQIELQVSGDEETANAIIAAAKEQGGAFIKIASGEMYRVKSVQSKAKSDTDDSDQAARAVEWDGGRFKCMLCERGGAGGDGDGDGDGEAACSGDAATVQRHLSREHGVRVFLCACGHVAASRALLLAHADTVYTAPHGVVRCTARSATHGKNGIKLTDTQKGKVHECEVCQKKYGSRMLLADHMNVHHGLRPYRCGVCARSYANKYTYHAHLNTHTDRPRPFECEKCGKTFLTSQNLTQHQNTHYTAKDFICKVCGKAFGTRRNLEVHGVVHSGRRPFACAEPGCGKAFARCSELRDHARTHTGERPFVCGTCGASFSQRSNLQSHRRATHLDDRRHACKLCPKRFKRRRLLDYHVQAAHTGERPLRCAVCRAGFVYPEHHKKHMLIHSGLKQFECEVCGKAFNSRDNRNIHRFTHSDKKPYECVVCGAGFMRKQKLYAHMNRRGHLAESIVVNQPRITKVSNATDDITGSLEMESCKEDIPLTIEENGAEFFITTVDNKKFILQDSKPINYVEGNSETALVSYNADGGAKCAGVDLEQLGNSLTNDGQQLQINTGDGPVRVVQFQTADGNNGWLAINQG